MRSFVSGQFSELSKKDHIAFLASVHLCLFFSIYRLIACLASSNSIYTLISTSSQCSPASRKIKAKQHKTTEKLLTLPPVSLNGRMASPAWCFVSMTDSVNRMMGRWPVHTTSYDLLCVDRVEIRITQPSAIVLGWRVDWCNVGMQWFSHTVLACVRDEWKFKELRKEGKSQVRVRVHRELYHRYNWESCSEILVLFSGVPLGATQIELVSSSCTPLCPPVEQLFISFFRTLHCFVAFVFFLCIYKRQTDDAKRRNMSRL